MIGILLLTLLANEPATAIGTIQVGRGLLRPTVFLIQKDEGVSLRLTGEPVNELKALQSTKVEVVGSKSEGRFVVAEYRIVALPSGERPTAIGVVTSPAEQQLGLLVDDGAPIPLNAAPRLRKALHKLLGAKLWIVGEKLLSGEIKVVRFGVLRRKEAPSGKMEQKDRESQSP